MSGSNQVDETEKEKLLQDVDLSSGENSPGSNQEDVSNIVQPTTSTDVQTPTYVTSESSATANVSIMGSVMSTMKQVGFLALAGAHLYCVSKLVEPGSSLFSWHPLLTSAAFGLIMPEAFTQISRNSEFGKRVSYRSRVTLHWMLQVAAVVLAGVGVGCIIVNKNQNNRPHLKTFHSVFGALTLTYAVLQSVGGLFIMYPKLKPSYAPNQGRMKVYHAVSAAALMAMAALSMFFSNYSVYMAKHKMATTVYATGMWIYPSVLGLRSLYTIYETGAFGKLRESQPTMDRKDTTL